MYKLLVINKRANHTNMDNNSTFKNINFCLMLMFPVIKISIKGKIFDTR